MLCRIRLLSAEACLDNVDNIVAELLQFVNHVHIECADSVVVFVIVHRHDVLGFQTLAQLVDVVLDAEGLADVVLEAVAVHHGLHA